MNDLISVVVPIYKVEKYLKKCVNSILNQTYKNLEIILVDDGSPDNCGKICDDFKEQDKRIIVLHKENGGLSDARNSGLKVARGKYICFIDSDDYLNEDYIKVLYDNIVQNNSDISICAFQQISEFEGIDILNNIEKNDAIIMDKMQSFNALYEGNITLEMVVAWNKLYKKSLWENLEYPKGKIHEDEFVIHELIANSESIVYTKQILYYYVQRENSITGVGTNIKTLDKFEALKNRSNFFKEKNYLELYKKALYSICASSRFAYINTKNKCIKNELSKIFDENYYKCINSKITIKNRIKLWIFKYFIFIVILKQKFDSLR